MIAKFGDQSDLELGIGCLIGDDQQTMDNRIG